MALTVIASWGGPTSNCYVDLSYANEFMETKVKRDAWDAAGEPQRAASLVEATRLIDRITGWRGSKYYWNQRLEFPRTLFSERDRYTTVIGTPYNVEYQWMENDVKNACCEQALWLLKQGGEDPLAELYDRGVRSFSESIGKISESYTLGAGSSGLSPEAMRLLSKYRSGRMLVRA